MADDSFLQKEGNFARRDSKQNAENSRATNTRVYDYVQTLGAANLHE